MMMHQLSNLRMVVIPIIYFFFIIISGKSSISTITTTSIFSVSTKQLLEMTSDERRIANTLKEVNVNVRRSE